MLELPQNTLVVFVSDSHIGGDPDCDGFESPAELTELFDELAAARSFGDAVGWTTGSVTTRNGGVLVHMEGPPPLPNTDRLRTELEKRGVDPSEVHVELVPARLVTFD